MLRAFQWDLARQAERLDWLLAQLPRYADWGFQELYLHLEDAVEYPSLPGVARAGAYSRRQMQRLVDAAGRAGIGIVPIVNLLGHTQYLVKVPALQDLNELRDPQGRPLAQGQICPVHPRTLEVADRLLRDVAPWCTAGRVHVGLDESFHLGRHPLSRRDIARHGLAGHFGRYVQRLHRLTEARGLQLGMWADMLHFLPGAIPLLPPGIAAYDWYYYPFARHPRVELFNFAEGDLAGPLQARGVEYWGCPMNGSFRHEPLPLFGDRLANIRSWWDRCRRTRAAGMLITSWESSRLAQELTTVVDAAAANLWLEPRRTGDRAMLARGFERVFRVRDGTAAARAALAADRHPFAGYARWETNARWDASAPGDKPENDSHRLHALARAASSVPVLDQSLRFRAYLADRERAVRRFATQVAELRRATVDPRRLDRILRQARISLFAFARLLRRARRAPRGMWAATRDRRRSGPNDRMLGLDGDRLVAWLHWLGEIETDPRRAWTASPVLGAWQLTFTVRNFAPALQKVVVQGRRPDGRWRDLLGRFTIEFQAAAARPRADIRRAFSLPVESPEVRLRIVVRGLGQVKIGRPTLTDGVHTLTPRGWSRAQWKLLGRAAPTRGLPSLDWQRNEGLVALEWTHDRSARAR